ncbi:AraC family transcriptional regulator [Paracoccus sp. TK19116]|uniref:AraC family transcriptional regulator n=1 Tax=Paracoccus albicereus TaxID=2922394 RepID=A0ABT1MQ13_9RHOB|nr:AraC family transcriptional regulator [Paracoccus albicereus]MCQ0970407.1 AraC family transcriptional regulator [Paracoccus albicereus]
MRVDLPRAHYPLQTGDVRFLPAGTAFASMPLTGAKGMALLLAPDLARDCEPALPDRMIAGGIGTDASGLMSLLIQLAREGAEDNRQARAAIGCQLGLLSITLQRLSPAAERPAAAPNTPTDLTLVQRFIALADAELGHGRTVSDLAEELGTTSAALDRACLAARGRRAIQLIHDLRHEQAVRALRRSTRPLDLIARDLGYTSLAHFNRAFVAATGRLPAMFRIDDGTGKSASASA